MAKKKEKLFHLVGIVEDRNVLEAFEKLQVNLNLSSVDSKNQVVQVTSSVQDEGKTTVVVNLANSYVNKGLSVLIIDLDIRRPKIHRNFNQVNDNGIVDYIAGNITKDKLFKKTKYGIDVITSGSKVPYPVKILESEKLHTFIDEMRSQYDVIILDTPPVSAVVDPIIVTKYSDAVLFVVQADRVKKSLVKESLKQLEMSSANIAGLILTSVKSRGGYYSNYKYYTSED